MSLGTWHLSGFGSQSTQPCPAWQVLAAPAARRAGCRQEGRQLVRVLAFPSPSPGRGTSFGRGSAAELWWEPPEDPATASPSQLGWVALPKSPHWLSGIASAPQLLPRSSCTFGLDAPGWQDDVPTAVAWSPPPASPCGCFPAELGSSFLPQIRCPVRSLLPSSGTGATRAQEDTPGANGNGLSSLWDSPRRGAPHIWSSRGAQVGERSPQVPGR